MPAIKQITKERILSAAVDILRKDGMDAINARRLATELGCSTQPIYLAFSGMDELKQAVETQIRKVYEAYLRREEESELYLPYKAYGMGYIRFAKEEREMFRYLFMRKRADNQSGDKDDQTMSFVLPAAMEATGLNREQAQQFHGQLWIHVHGIATMLATEYYDWDMELISTIISECYLALLRYYQGKGEESHE
ncbi:MAG: TetR/AcrR family transcriptional regulator [Eubacteriales bacterium]